MKKFITFAAIGLIAVLVLGNLEGISAEKMPMKQIREIPLTDENNLYQYSTKLWSDTSLGTSGKSCASCHPDGALLSSKPYPRYIEMTGDILTLDQMINFCMTNPMKAESLDWNSKDMTALALYVKMHSTPPAE